MLIHMPIGAAIFFYVILVVSFIQEVCPKKLRKHVTPVKVPKREEPPFNEEAYTAVKAVVASHTDYTAEVAEAFVKPDRAWLTQPVAVGSPVELWYNHRTKRVNLYVDHEYAAQAKFSVDGRVPGLLAKGHPIEAYIGGRDSEGLTSFDLLQIIAFYKVDGVAPTTVNLVVNR